MGVSAADVKQLREKTGAGMIDCKKALVEAEGDFDKAEKILKELGLAAAAKRSGRATNEGRVFTKVDGGKAVLLELTCETDFVARNKDFEALGNSLVDDVIARGLTEADDSMKQKVTDAISTIKENISLNRIEVMDIAANELVSEYVHGEGGLGVLVKLTAGNAETVKKDEVKSFAFDCALHIAAFNPAYLSKDTVDPGYLKEQEEIFTAQAMNMGKPEKVIQGIVQGKLKKHLAEICFLNQPFVKDDKQSVEAVMKGIAKEVGDDLSVTDFRYVKAGA